MADHVLENDESTQTNVTQEQEETVEATTETVTEEKQSQAEEVETSPEEAQVEPTIEIDGQQVPLSRAKEALDRYSNDEKWTAKNTQRAQELAAKEKELQQKIWLASQVEGRPELIQQLFTPKPERDLEKELQAHWQRRPYDINTQEYINWEYQKDLLMGEIAESRAAARAEKKVASFSAETWNTQLSNSAREKFKDEAKVVQMAQWVVDNIKPDAMGRYPAHSFETASKILFSEEEQREAKLAATRKVTESIVKAKPASGDGGKKITQPESDLTEDDEKFIEEVKARK